MRVADRTHRWSLLSHRRVPRTLHPVAWWIWALGLADGGQPDHQPHPAPAGAGRPRAWWWPTAAARPRGPGRSSTTCTWLLPWSPSGCVFRSVFGGDIDARSHARAVHPAPRPAPLVGGRGPARRPGHPGGHALGPLRRPAAWGRLLCCLGAANALANPKRALRVLPGALYELGVAVVVSLSVAPQLVESVQRVRRARKLRGGTAVGRHALRSIAIPVLEDALERSLRLAAAMDSRGYGRTAGVSSRARRTTGGGHAHGDVRPVRRRLRPARRHRTAAARSARLARRIGAVLPRPGPGQPPRAPHPVPAGPLEAARMGGGRSPGWSRRWCSSPGAVSGRPASTPRPIR